MYYRWSICVRRPNNSNQPGVLGEMIEEDISVYTETWREIFSIMSTTPQKYHYTSNLHGIRPR